MLDKNIIANRKGHAKAKRDKIVKRKRFILEQLEIFRKKIYRGEVLTVTEIEKKRLFELEDKSAWSALLPEEKAELSRLRTKKEREPAIPA